MRTEPYTAEERLPFTTDPEAVAYIDNIFCRGLVQCCEDEAGFVGWIVQAQRPLALCLPTKMEPDRPEKGVLLYSSNGTVFPTYGEAVEAVIRTAVWFSMNGHYAHGPVRIFGVNRL